MLRGVSLLGGLHCPEGQKTESSYKVLGSIPVLSLLNESGEEISPSAKCALQSALFGKVLMQRQALVVEPGGTGGKEGENRLVDEGKSHAFLQLQAGFQQAMT